MLITDIAVNDGIERVHNFSSSGKKVVREDGVVLEEAWDIIGTNHTYTESEEEMKYSVRSIIRELKAVGKFAAVRQMLEAANFDWDFVGSNYLSTDDADFTAMLTAIVSSGILTQEELYDLLPKCIWVQTPMS